jgi:hypothetical protein
VVNSTDGRGNTSNFDYTDPASYQALVNPPINPWQGATPACYPNCATFAFVTQATNPLSQITAIQYDYYLGNRRREFGFYERFIGGDFNVFGKAV